MDCECVKNEAKPAIADAENGRRADDLGVVRANGEFRLVAIRAIAAGERLFRIEGDPTHRPSRFSVQIAEDLHIDLQPNHATEEILDRYFWRFMNHSCNPNAVVRGRDVFSRHAIAPWTSVTFNYNTTEWDMAEPFTCCCGAAECLGVIRGFKHLGPQQRDRLRSLVASHLKAWLPEQSAERDGVTVA